jgi:hypothetical protein
MKADIPTTALSVDASRLCEPMDEWALAIGRFLVAFTSCEYWTYMFIRTYGSENLRDSVVDLMLKPRAAIAHALITDIGLLDQVQQRVDQAFSELNRLATPRNLVAHNSPMVHVYQDDKGGLFVRHELRSARDESKDITVERLNELTAKARELDEELALLYGVVRQQKNHRDQ